LDNLLLLPIVPVMRMDTKQLGKKTLEIGVFLETSLTRLTLISGHISGWVIFALMIWVVVAVFARRVIGHPIVVSDEYAGYLMVFCVFLGAGYTLQRDAHIRVDIIAIRLNERLRVFLRAVTSCFSLIYGVVLMWKSAELVHYYKMTGQRALSIMETPTWIPAIVIPIGVAVLNFQIFLCILNEIRFLLRGNH